jgi:hypothetical protein
MTARGERSTVDFAVGGPVNSLEQVYISRDADAEFIALLGKGEFVNIVTSRQMGKTSLVYHAMAQLSRESYCFAYYDLSKLRFEKDRSIYFRTLLEGIHRDMSLDWSLESFWSVRQMQTASESFIDFFRQLLARIDCRIVVVLDEIDATLTVEFTDDLYTAIRSIYTARPREDAFTRLMFTLVGVTTPNELIKTRSTTPYNVGRTIWLRDFDPDIDDLSAFQRVLSADPAIARTLLDRVMYWTGGQPFLTAWLCDELRCLGASTSKAVDKLIEGKFSNIESLSSDSHFEQTLRFIHERDVDRGHVLGLYERVLRGKRERDQPANLVFAHLRLSGLVKTDRKGFLVARNRIYKRVFDLDWVAKSKPRQELKRARWIAWAAAAALVGMTTVATYYYFEVVRPLQTRPPARFGFDPSIVSCVVAVQVGSGARTLDVDLSLLAGVGVLAGTDEGLFILRGVDGYVTSTPVRTQIGDRVLRTERLRDGSVLVLTAQGWFVASGLNGDVTLHAVNGPTASDFRTVAIPGGQLLLATRDQLFVVRPGSLFSRVVGSKVFGQITQLVNLGDAGTLVRSQEGLYRALPLYDSINVTRIPELLPLGEIRDTQVLPGTGVLISAARGLYLLGGTVDRPTLVPVIATDALDTRLVRGMWRVADGSILVASEEGWYFATTVGGRVRMYPLDLPRRTGNPVEVPGVGVLLTNGSDVYRVSRGETGEAVTSSMSGDDDFLGGRVVVPGVGVLMQNAHGFALARANSSRITVDSTNLPDVGTIYNSRDLPGTGVLISAQKGVFLAMVSNGRVGIQSLGTEAVGEIRDEVDLPGAGVILNGERGLFLAAQVPLRSASVHVASSPVVAPGRVDETPDHLVQLSVAHPCAPVLGQLHLTARLRRPDGKTESVPTYSIEAGRASAVVTFGLPSASPGTWNAQLVAGASDSVALVGRDFELPISRSGSLRDALLHSALGLFALLLSSLFLLSALMLFVARRSSVAWRLVTGRWFGGTALRIVLFLVYRSQRMQLWLLDLYFLRRREQIDPPQPFVPISLRHRHAEPMASDRVVAPPWKGKRLWIQGAGGMGKSTLFRRITSAHFRDHTNVFEAFQQWGCVIVVLPLHLNVRLDWYRGSDRILHGIRYAFLLVGLDLQNDALLEAMLMTGTLGIAIDGLSEVSRASDVAEFALRYPLVPMLVTSRESAMEGFEAWSLPTDFQNYFVPLAAEYLDWSAASHLYRRVSESGLLADIKTGYDIRLLTMLAQGGGENGSVPTKRKSLYAEALRAGWPGNGEEEMREQQYRTFSAAWRAASERRSSLVADVDLPASLLEALADAPIRNGTPFRLVARVGEEFEFVHSQMHAYLAARWFAQDHFTVADLMRILRSSTMGEDSLAAQRALWSFAAELLDSERLVALWMRVEDQQEWDALRRELKKEAEARGLAHERLGQLGDRG